MKITIDTTEELNALLEAWVDAQDKSVRRVKYTFTTQGGASIDFAFTRPTPSESPDGGRR